jgi:hypothetical protein
LILRSKREAVESEFGLAHSQVNQDTPVNMTLVICKDVAFAKLFRAPSASTAPPAPLPIRSLSLFAVRDSHTIAASFVLPPLVSAKLVESGWVRSRGAADMLAQLLCPAVVQLASTPYHLIALDLYNRPNVTMTERWALVRQKYAVTTAARVGRIGPAFGPIRLDQSPA